MIRQIKKDTAAVFLSRLFLDYKRWMVAIVLLLIFGAVEMIGFGVSLIIAVHDPLTTFWEIPTLIIFLAFAGFAIAFSGAYKKETYKKL